MRIVFLGSGEFGCPSLKWLSESGHEVAEVITQPARPAGRGKNVAPTPIAELAGTLHLKVCECGDVNDPAVVEHVQSLRPEVLLVIAFGQKIGGALLNLPPTRAINLHGSLLPRYRGAAPINWAIINGEKETGVTVIELNERWDAGAILGQARTAIAPTETAGELHDRLALLGPPLVEDILARIAQGNAQPLIQDEKQACRAPKLQKTDGAIHWEQGAEQIRNRIHGLWPWPGAFCMLAQKTRTQAERVAIARAEVVVEAGGGAWKGGTVIPGTVMGDMTIACGEGRLRMLQVRPDNGKLMDFAAFVNGRHLQSGDRFLNG
jgi:methionyl-tRNA formyltransferase